MLVQVAEVPEVALVIGEPSPEATESPKETTTIVFGVILRLVTALFPWESRTSNVIVGVSPVRTSMMGPPQWSTSLGRFRALT